MSTDFGGLADLFGEGVDLIGRKTVIAGGYDYPVMKGGFLAFGEMKIQGPEAFAEDLLAKGIGGEEAVAAGMPIGRVAGISGVVDDDDAEGIVSFFAIEHTPVAAGGPGAVACFARAGQVITVDIGGITGGYFCDIAFIVQELAGCIAGDLQLFGDAQAEEPIFGVGEGDVGERGKGGDAVDDPPALPSLKDVDGMFVKQSVSRLVGPTGIESQGIFPGFHVIGMDPAVLAFFCGRDRIGVIPEIKPVDILIVEPEPDMMGMIDGFARAGFYREAAGNQLFIAGVDWIEHGFLERIGVHEGGKRLPVGGDRNDVKGGVGDYLYLLLLSLETGRQTKGDKQVAKTFSKIVDGKIDHITAFA